MSDNVSAAQPVESEGARELRWFGLTVCVAVLLLQTLWQIVRNARANVYDFFIIRMTSLWYRVVLERVPGGARLLDVGVGTATALVRSKEILERKNITVVGIDYDKAYIDKAATVVGDAGLGKRILLNCTSIQNPKLRAVFTGTAKFDAAYFSGSLTLMPDPVAALKCTAGMLTDNGVIYVTQTFQNRPSPIMERIKPLLRRFTSIDFGRVTYYSDVHNIVQKAGLAVIEDGPIPGSIDNASQTARLLVLKPTGATKKD